MTVVKMFGNPTPKAVLPPNSEPSERQIDLAARVMFDRANPDGDPTISNQDRARQFDITRDYWVRAAHEVARVLGGPMAMNCPCEYSVTGPAQEVVTVVLAHKCVHTRDGNERHY